MIARIMERAGTMKFDAKLMIGGVFGPDDIRAAVDDGEVSIPEELTADVEKLWASKAERGWKPLPLLHLKSAQLLNGTLNLRFIRTNGKDFIGSSNWDFWRARGIELDLDRLPNPLVTSSVIATADKKMIIQQRGEGAHQSGNIDALGGHLDPSTDIDVQTGLVDLFSSALREVCEEVGLDVTQIEQIRSLGLVYNYHDVSHWAMPFVITTPLTSAEILLLKRDDEEKNRVGLIVVEPDRLASNSPLNIINVIRRYYPDVDPEARIAVLLAMTYLEGTKRPARDYADKAKLVEIFKGS